jgi:rare lipoprotein A
MFPFDRPSASNTSMIKDVIIH